MMIANLVAFFWGVSIGTLLVGVRDRTVIILGYLLAGVGGAILGHLIERALIP